MLRMKQLTLQSCLILPNFFAPIYLVHPSWDPKTSKFIKHLRISYILDYMSK